VTRSLATLLSLCSLLPALGACDLFSVDDDGEPFAVATDQGSLLALRGGTDSAALLWEGQVAPSSRASIVADGSAVFVGSGQEVKALSRDGGAALWAAPAILVGDVVALAGPGDGAVFAMTLDGTLAAINTGDGATRWTLDLLVDLPGSSDDALAFAGGSLLLGGDPIRSLDPADGSVRAEYPSGDSYVSGMVVVGGTLFAGLADGVVALDLSSLAEQWRHGTEDEVDNLVASSTSVFYSVVGQGVGVLTTTGNPVGVAGGDGVFEALAMSSDNLLLGARSDATLFAWDESTLAEQWSVSASNPPVQGLVTTTLSVFYANGGYIDGITLEDGSSLWSYQAPGSPVGMLGL
jgi:outer membrane protein assembly factor BamB